MSAITRTFTRAELGAIGAPHYLPKDVEVLDEQYDTRRWVSVNRLLFRHDGRVWEIFYEKGLTEYQEDTDPWNGEDEIQATAVEEQQVTLTQWVPVEAPEVAE